MARKKSVKKNIVSNKELDTSHFFCIVGGCVWIMTDAGWEHFEACGEGTNCTCPSTPPMLTRLAETGKAFVVLCEDDNVAHQQTILSEGFVTFRSGFKIDQDHVEDYCVAISERLGKWRYCHRGTNRHRDQHKGYLDAVFLPRGVARLDRLNSNGTASVELGAIGLLDPNFGSDPAIQEELAKYRSKKAGSA